MMSVFPVYTIGVVFDSNVHVSLGRGKCTNGKCKIFSRDSRRVRNHDKGRRDAQYFLREISRERRKQTKRRYDTHRIVGELVQQDLQMEKIYIEHFCGQKSDIIASGIVDKYDTININICDLWSIPSFDNSKMSIC
jgi:hypothetical protein